MTGDEPRTIRDDYHASFDELNRRLSTTPLDRHVRFFNFGYVPLEGERPLGPRLSRSFPNPDSAQLLFQLVADAELRDLQVVEIGCGRGGNVALLRDALGAGTVVGVDLALPSLQYAARIVGPPGGFVQGDAEVVPLADRSADVVLNVESAGCYPQLERFFREVARILRPGGLLLYADLIRSPLVHRYEEVLTELGLDVVESRDITPNVLASRTQRGARERAALGKDHGDPLAEWVGQSGSALHTALGDGSWTYQLFRLRRSDRAAPASDRFTAEEQAAITASAAHWAAVLHLDPAPDP